MTRSSSPFSRGQSTRGRRCGRCCLPRLRAFWIGARSSSSRASGGQHLPPDGRRAAGPGALRRRHAGPDAAGSWPACAGPGRGARALARPDAGGGERLSALGALLEYAFRVGEAAPEQLLALAQAISSEAEAITMTAAEKLRAEGEAEGKAELLLKLLTRSCPNARIPGTS
jgi:hypothetical protein